MCSSVVVVVIVVVVVDVDVDVDVVVVVWCVFKILRCFSPPDL